ncbi:UvrABC system protein A [Clostridia bacterium]|nr:UvrABC system protein A [Clostridia bacterium]
MIDALTVRGAREHNLKNINITIPRNKLVVFTGLSGSGKSSLAFDTIYAEGQRRYVESLSAYARQFLGQMEKPDVDGIEGLSPAISIDQKTTSRNPRSTVGTVTEINDYLRLLYARVGIPHCHKCGREIAQQSVDQMVDQIMSLPEGARLTIFAPIVRKRKGEHVKMFEDLRKEGYVRVRIDGELYETDDVPSLDKQKNHFIDVVIDRIINKPGINSRLTDSLESALKLANGLVSVDAAELGETLYSQNYACPECGVSIEDLTPRMFSFNSPFGACPTCTGLGMLRRVDPDAVLKDKSLTLRQGAISVSGWNNAKDEDSIAAIYIDALAKQYGFSTDIPVRDLPESAINLLLYGTNGEKVKITYQRENGGGSYMAPFEGIVNNLERRYRETQSEGMKDALEQLMLDLPCPDCGGRRLKPETLAVTVGGRSISAVSDDSVVDAREFFDKLRLSEQHMMIAELILKEIKSRLGFLANVGLSYLTLSRAAGSLSGGEAQRIRLATQIGSSLVGVLYILDEPSIGLHQRDNEKLLHALKGLRDLGNSLIVVEHDEETMFAADHIVDIGPGAGIHGGCVIAQGTVDEIMQNPNSLTGLYLSGKKSIAIPQKRRKPSGYLTIKSARANNLTGMDARIPLGVFTCVTGVSGSGKSSLVNEILYKALARDLNRAKSRPGPHGGIDGLEQLDKIISIDQSPIGRTPRSNPATYTGVFDQIRRVFAATNEAKARGYKENRFSFNVKGGRCEACGGDGILKIEMHFLPDIYVPCEVCKGKRYNRETLEVKYRDKSIFDVLDMTVEDALEFFEHHRTVMQVMRTLYDVGLGYIKLGQPSTTLSGGEAQRVKLATELSRKATGRTIYVLDEPTTGLHVADVARLIDVLQRLTDQGNSVVVIEHNLDVIKCADYCIDMGPEGGTGGGQIVASGTPEELCKIEDSYTGQFLRKALK